LGNSCQGDEEVMEVLKLTHHDLSSSASRFAGRRVDLQGVLTVEGERAYLVLDPGDSKIEVAIRDIGFVDRLLGNVPCYVGGRYLYRDTASLQGTLTVEGSSQIALRDVISVRITREDEEFEF
jgi:hypothetical protein